MLRSQECTVFLVRCISTGINTLVLGGGDAGGESSTNRWWFHGNSQGLPFNSWLPCGQTGFKQFCLGHNYSVKKRIPVAYPLIFQLTRYLEPGVDRYLIYKFQIHKELEDQGYYTNQPGIFGSFFGAKNLSLFIEVEHHHVENLKPHLLRLHCYMWGFGVLGFVVMVRISCNKPKKTRDLIKEKIRIMVNSIHCQSFTRYLLDRVPPPPRMLARLVPPRSVGSQPKPLKGPPLLGGG